MSDPRPVYPGRFLLITRRCTQRQFLLRPDDETNNAFVYCLAEAAKRFELEVVLSQMMSNHHHTVVYDRHGREVEFRGHFHKLVAKCQNALRGRRENLWSSEEPSVVELITHEDLMSKLVYVATNPVKDGLVEQVHQWPGPKLVAGLLTGTPLRAHRPKHFFRADGPMPASVELCQRLPADFEQPDVFLEELRRQITADEEGHARARQASGRCVFGRARIRRQSWRDSATSLESGREIRPRVAARSKWHRTAVLERNAAFVAAYRRARKDWLAGVPTVFPYGTYWLARFANVSVAVSSPNMPLAS